MPFIYLQKAKKITLVGSIILLLSACSSPIKYEPSKPGSLSENKTSNQTANRCRSPHVVRSGDTLSGIARDCDVDMQAIANLNDLLPPYIIYVKQELLLPNKYSHEEVKTVVKPIQTEALSQKNVTKIKPENTVSKNALKTQSVSPKEVDSTKKSTHHTTAKAIDRSDNKLSKTKSKVWQWPMHKGLSYKYLRDNAGLSVLEIYGVPGQKVKAVAPGKVVYAGNGIINYGWMLVIKHDNDYMSIYAHNSALLVKEGDTVYSGETVATMGATGNTKRPKLYLEARYQGRKIDIKKILKP